MEYLSSVWLKPTWQIGLVWWLLLLLLLHTNTSIRYSVEHWWWVASACYFKPSLAYLIACFYRLSSSLTVICRFKNTFWCWNVRISSIYVFYTQFICNKPVLKIRKIWTYWFFFVESKKNLLFFLFILLQINWFISKNWSKLGIFVAQFQIFILNY